MGRIVGDSKTYPLMVDVALILENDSKLLGSVGLEAPSISTIAKVFDFKSGALTGWAFKSGLEGVLKLNELGIDFKGWTYEQLYESLKSQGFTPYVKRGRAADRGNEAHEVLERLAQGEDETSIGAYIDEITGEAKGYAEGVWNWWHDQGPLVQDVLLTESVVFGFHPKPFAGTLDLYAFREGTRRLTDLKTSKDLYVEMLLQLDGYDEGITQSSDHGEPEEHSILLVDAEGGYDEIVVPSFKPAWNAAVDAYYALQELDALYKGAKKAHKDLKKAAASG